MRRQGPSDDLKTPERTNTFSSKIEFKLQFGPHPMFLSTLDFFFTFKFQQLTCITMIPDIPPDLPVLVGRASRFSVLGSQLSAQLSVLFSVASATSAGVWCMAVGTVEHFRRGQGVLIKDAHRLQATLRMCCPAARKSGVREKVKGARSCFLGSATKRAFRRVLASVDLPPL
ncbi:hypothetical protein FIBSPDRAFT_179243 [Athelia psychrophila]|uniref:Uncharacterized protein n=1 Tax=Athelia psychrophila TaxID=1759441 RepID=A0A166SSG5_9AGAM|nr:hypothetical protein FIBSPDRAFT_179243 [Fibularhizoctonia sp. CBS 109695]